MFGCSQLLRNWTSEGVRGNKSPTHVNVYRAPAIKAGKSGLDRQGMVLVALMSGGDYIPAGIPNCGIKTACEAARAGFGQDLFDLDPNDAPSVSRWRERLAHELRCNESGYFRVKRKALAIPETFPDKQVLYYYVHPVVSTTEQINRYRETIRWDSEVDICGLRTFTVNAFAWNGLEGAKHFIRSLAPALLGHKLAPGMGGQSNYDEDPDDQMAIEAKLVKSVCGKRFHVTTDGIAELRLAYIPIELANIDLSAESEPSDTHTAVYQDPEDDPRDADAEISGKRSPSPTKRCGTSFDPCKLEKDYFPETFAKLGVPVTVENWESEQASRKGAARNTGTNSKPRSKGLRNGTLDAFVKVSKPLSNVVQEPEKLKSAQAHSTSRTDRQPLLDLEQGKAEGTKGKKPSKSTEVYASEEDAHTSAWTLSQRSSGVPKVESKNTKEVSHGLKSSRKVKEYDGNTPPKEGRDRDVILISSSPPPESRSNSRRGSQLNSNDPALRRNGLLASPNPKGNPVISESHISETDCATQNRPTLPNSKGRRRAHLQLDHGPVTPSKNGFPASSSPSLPAPSMLLSLSEDSRVKSTKTLSAQNSPAKAAQRRKKKIVLRESLEGTWKYVDENEAQGIASNRRFSRVEILDLTGA